MIKNILLTIGIIIFVIVMLSALFWQWLSEYLEKHWPWG